MGLHNKDKAVANYSITDSEMIVLDMKTLIFKLYSLKSMWHNFICQPKMISLFTLLSLSFDEIYVVIS